MNARSIRRAAERKAQKARAREARAHESEQLSADGQETAAPAFCFDSPAEECETVSAARLQANRLNAQFSTGPRTAEGKSKVSLNAVKTGLTGRTVMLPSDDAAAYENHLAQYRREYQPEGLRESELVQSLADTAWRLGRIPGLEIAIYSLGRLEFASSCDSHPLELRNSLIELKTFLKYEKQLRNLQLQEARLHRRYDKEMAELRELQKDRVRRKQAAAANKERLTPRKEGASAEEPPQQPKTANAPGFVFSASPEEAQTAATDTLQAVDSPADLLSEAA